MTINAHIDKQISPGSAMDSRLAFTADTYALSVVNTGRYGYFDGLLIPNIAGASAVRAFILNNFTCSVAIRTGLNISHHAE